MQHYLFSLFPTRETEREREKRTERVAFFLFLSQARNGLRDRQTAHFIYPIDIRARALLNGFTK
jgi:hypothetical protein